MAKFIFSVSTKYMGSDVEEEVEIDDKELEGLNDLDRAKVIEEHYIAWRNEELNGSWEEIE